MQEQIQKVDISDIYALENLMHEIPQTYNTLVSKCADNNTTEHAILRRKLNNLCRNGNIMKLAIPGTRGGQVLFYAMPKCYKLLIQNSGLGSRIFYFNKYQKIDAKNIKVQECWELNNDCWKNIGLKEFSEFFVLLFF